MAKITFWAGENCLFSGITGLMDAFSIANLWHRAMVPQATGPLFDCQVVTTDGKPVRAYGGLAFKPAGSLADAPPADFIIVPPYLPHVVALPAKRDPVYNWIRDHHARRKPVGTMCSGTFLLAETGLLDGKVATVNWHFARMFKQRYPRVRLKPELMMSEDDGLICTGATTAMFQLALYMISLFGSAELAGICSKVLLVDPSRQSQSPYMISDFNKSHGDEAVLKAQFQMETRYADNLQIDALAGDAGLSSRHFKRRFKQATGESPLEYLQRVRIEQAKQRLETTRDTMNEITWQIGYEDSSSFRRLFKKFTGLAPRAYRDKFSRL
jgi:transcriptional regulator GlxA family with amidase domain